MSAWWETFYSVLLLELLHFPVQQPVTDVTWISVLQERAAEQKQQLTAEKKLNYNKLHYSPAYLGYNVKGWGNSPTFSLDRDT